MKKYARTYNLNGVGTGTWWTLETIAYHTDTVQKLGYFAFVSEVIAENFVCMECREHFQQFMSQTPVDQYILDVNGEFNRFAAFQWIWEAHNNANQLTHKPKYSYFEAIKYQEKLASGEACTDCNVSHSHASSGERAPSRPTKRSNGGMRVKYRDI